MIEQHFQFKAFGSTLWPDLAPRVFMKALAPVVSFFKLFPYMDARLISDSSVLKVDAIVNKVCSCLESLGFITNYQKSSLRSEQRHS